MDELDNLTRVIDWYNFVISSLWVLGLAGLLATLSLAHWLADQNGSSFRQILFQTSFRPVFFITIILIALGLLLSAESWWIKIGWAGLIVMSFWEGVVVSLRRPHAAEQS